MQSQCLTLPLAFAYGKSHSMAPSEEEVQTAIRHRALLAHPMGCNVNKFLELFWFPKSSQESSLGVSDSNINGRIRSLEGFDSMKVCPFLYT